jgi:hypothetical protein
MTRLRTHPRPDLGHTAEGLCGFSPDAEPHASCGQAAAYFFWWHTGERGYACATHVVELDRSVLAFIRTYRPKEGTA